MTIRQLMLSGAAVLAVFAACGETPAKAKKSKKAKTATVAKADGFPAAREFKTGLLYDSENKVTAEFEQPQIELPDWSFETFKGGTVVDDLFSRLDTLDMVMVGSLAADAFTGQADQWRKFLERGGTLVITDAGYGPYFSHSYGHSLGLEIHENPGIHGNNKEPLPAGVVASAEPGIYIPGKFGVRIEDVTIVGTDGCENITHANKELIIL